MKMMGPKKKKAKKSKKDKRREKQAKQEAQKRESFARKEKATASRLSGAIASVLYSIEAMEDRLTGPVKQELPEFQLKDLEASGNRLKELQSKWSKIQRGQSTKKQEQVDENSTNHRISQVKTALCAFGRLVDSAETILQAKSKDKKDKKDKKSRS